MKRIKKPNKFCKLFGIDIEFEKKLKDAEVRLYYILLRLVDWDQKHKNTFGSTDITFRALLDLLPARVQRERNWSLAKLSYTLNSLIRKGWLEKRADGRIGVKNYQMYRTKSVQLAEQLVQQTRQDVQVTELPVQSTEKGSLEGPKLVRNIREELREQWSVNVHSAEHAPAAKETLKIHKEN